MPPKWVLGYMQSHRTLAGPQEPAQIVQTFRDSSCRATRSSTWAPATARRAGTSFTAPLDFNPKTFDDRPRTQALHDLKVKVILHVNKAPRPCTATPSRRSRTTPSTSTTTGLAQQGIRPGRGRLVARRRRRAAYEARLARHRCYYKAARGPAQRRPWGAAPQRLRGGAALRRLDLVGATRSRAGRPGGPRAGGDQTISLSLTRSGAATPAALSPPRS